MKKLFVAIICLTILLFSFGCGIKPQRVEKYGFAGVVERVDYVDDSTIVRFKDGRVKAFNGVSNATFQEGKFNAITYDGYNRIVLVE